MSLAVHQCFQLTCGISFIELIRTNNGIEGWHRSFNAQVSSYNPTFWKFLDNHKTKESLTRVQILYCLGGHPPPPQRRRYVNSSAQILVPLDETHLDVVRGLM